MKEIKHPVQTLRVVAACDKCGGDLKPTGQVYLTNPPQYPHSCAFCGATEVLRHRYPRIVHEEIKPGEEYTPELAKAITREEAAICSKCYRKFSLLGRNPMYEGPPVCDDCDEDELRDKGVL